MVLFYFESLKDLFIWTCRALNRFYIIVTFAIFICMGVTWCNEVLDYDNTIPNDINLLTLRR